MSFFEKFPQFQFCCVIFDLRLGSLAIGVWLIINNLGGLITNLANGRKCINKIIIIKFLKKWCHRSFGINNYYLYFSIFLIESSFFVYVFFIIALILGIYLTLGAYKASIMFNFMFCNDKVAHKCIVKIRQTVLSVRKWRSDHINFFTKIWWKYAKLSKEKKW